MSFLLHIERLILCPLRRDDAPVLAAYRNDPAVARYQGWTLPYTAQDAEELIAEMAGRVPGDPGWVQIGLEHWDTCALIGDVALNTSERQAELGVTLCAAAQGQGYAQEGLRALVAHAFGPLNLQQLHAEIDPHNVAVTRVPLALGFRHLSTTYGTYQNRGEWTDNAVYTLRREEKLN